MSIGIDEPSEVIGRAFSQPFQTQATKSFMPVMSIEEAKGRNAIIKQFIAEVLTAGEDYGVIPGTNSKPSLLKPGAEKLCTFFGLTVREPEVTEKVEDWTGEAHGGEPFFYCQVNQVLERDERVVASQFGSCNSWESRYRYRWSERLCPQCKKPAIIKGSEKYGGGFLCWAKKGGCGKKFADNDLTITQQILGKVKNPDVADIVNSVHKMAQKRAFVSATLVATATSQFFTVDMEDTGHSASAPAGPEPQTEPFTGEPIAAEPPQREEKNELMTRHQQVEINKAIVSNNVDPTRIYEAYQVSKTKEIPAIHFPDVMHNCQTKWKDSKPKE